MTYILPCGWSVLVWKARSQMEVINTQICKNVLQWYNELFFCQKSNSTAPGSGRSQKSHFLSAYFGTPLHYPLKIPLEGVWSVNKMDVKDKWDWMLQKKNIVVEHNFFKPLNYWTELLSEPGICWVWLKDEKYDVEFEHIVL